VTCDGRRLRTIGRGEGFGEIGLIRDIERTASVTAMTDALLLSIERGPFITAVTGHPESRHQADVIIDELLPTTATGRRMQRSAGS
jgi:CRP-like cAMP-binding protein